MAQGRIVQGDSKALLETLERLAAQQVEQITFGDFEKLQRLASSFIENVNIIRTHYQRVDNQSNLTTQLAQIYEAMRYEEGAVNDIIRQQQLFEEGLDKFLGRKIYLSYVYESGKVAFGDDFVLEQLYKEATAQRGRANISESKLTEELFDQIKDEKLISIKQQLNDSAGRKQVVYQKALGRYKDSKKYKKDKSEFINTYWWQKQPPDPPFEIGWTSKINNIGDIAEAYVDAVVHEQAEDWDASTETIEYHLYWLWHKYIQRNTTPAILRGDVVAQNDGGLQIHFAVKSGSFSTARLGQYYRFAQNIKKIKFLRAEDLLDESSSIFKTLISSSKATTALIEKINNETAELFNRTEHVDL